MFWSVFLTLFVEVTLFTVEKARAKYASALGAQSGGVHRAHLAALAGLKQVLLPPQMNFSLIG